jgi:hypothetical protein
MTRALRLVLAAACLAVLAAFAAPHALADPPPSCTMPGPQTLDSAHFRIFYNDDSTKTEYLSQAQAGTILATAERAYSSYVNDLGFPAPAVGTSGKTELRMVDLSPWKLSAYYCYGTADVDTKEATGSNADYNIVQTVFDEVEYIFAPSGADTWLMNGFGAWAAWHALAYPAVSTADVGPFDASLDCASANDKANCSTVGYENLGESRWPFYEFLAEKFGTGIAGDVVGAAQAAGGSGLVGLQNALAAKGTSLGAEYAAYAAKLLTGGWSATLLNALAIPVSGTAIQTGASTGDVPTTSFGVNHLATKFVEIDRGDTDGSHACYAANLALTVQIPSGVTSQPTFYWASAGSAPVPLVVSGSTATATIPWDTCKWTTKGYLSLPNTSLVDGTSFTVSGHLTVDYTKPASSSTPPAQSTQYGQTVDASTVSDVPDITLFGPQLLKIGADAKQLRLIVHSDGGGSVTASIGSTALGTSKVRAGGNDLRFNLPASLRLRLRRRVAGAIVLTVTAYAPDGKTAGETITRNVSIASVSPKRTK